MSLNFGLYLVEQGIISCDQFCGLVRMQQQLAPSPSTIAVQKNLLTIRQVAQVYESLEQTGHTDFLASAVALRFLSPRRAQIIQQLQQIMVPSLMALIIDCGLLTREQAQRLWQSQHQRQAKSPNESSVPVAREPHAPANARPREPKFKQRPVVVQNY